MQYLRTVDWNKVREVHSPVYDGHKLYDVRASYAGGAENIGVPREILPRRKSTYAFSTPAWK